jgi:hypothetical protein
MSSEKDGTNVPAPSSSPADSASPAPAARPSTPSNAFDAAFLARLEERDEPPAAEEADWAGPWRLDATADGGLELYRLGESAARGHRPVARFHQRWDALLAMAIIASRREAAYRLMPMADGPGYAVQSRAAWGETVGWLAVFDEDLVNCLSWADALMRSPEALSFFLEACGKVVLERAGAILEERVAAMPG